MSTSGTTSNSWAKTKRPDAHVPPGYGFRVSSESTSDRADRVYRPHPDDEADVSDAIAGADHGELLSRAGSESFLQWLEGSGDNTWRDELE